MVKWTTISMDNEFCNLSALLNDGSYNNVSLNFNDSNMDIWDDENYLINHLYPYLTNDMSNDEFDDLFEDIRKEVLEIFDEAIKMGFFTIL